MHVSFLNPLSLIKAGDLTAVAYIFALCLQSHSSMFRENAGSMVERT